MTTENRNHYHCTTDAYWRKSGNTFALSSEEKLQCLVHMTWFSSGILEDYPRGAKWAALPSSLICLFVIVSFSVLCRSLYCYPFQMSRKCLLCDQSSTNTQAISFNDFIREDQLSRLLIPPASLPRFRHKVDEAFRNQQNPVICRIHLSAQRQHEVNLPSLLLYATKTKCTTGTMTG